MVSKEGFNALLKLVEEPPSHLRFIFATTEPDKVIGTIKSRTHHYPFRLVAPKVLGDYVVDLCEREDVAIEPTVVPLVVRAGGGSVRDSLSVLDQLIGGSGPDGVTYDAGHRTARLHAGQPARRDRRRAGRRRRRHAVRRHREDHRHRSGPATLRRGPAAPAARPGRRLGRTRCRPPAGSSRCRRTRPSGSPGQAARFGRAELTRAADIVSQGLTDMRGATAPRLLLEIMCARDPAARRRRDRRRPRCPHRPGRAPDVGRRRRVGPDAGRASPLLHAPRQAAPPEATAPVERPVPVPPPVEATQPASARPPSRRHRPGSQRPREPAPAAEPPPTEQQAPAASSTPTKQCRPISPLQQPQPASSLSLVDVRQLWPGVLDRVSKMKRMTWMLLSAERPGTRRPRRDPDDRRSPRAPARTSCRAAHDEILRQALIDELGVDWKSRRSSTSRSGRAHVRAAATRLRPRATPTRRRPLRRQPRLRPRRQATQTLTASRQARPAGRWRRAATGRRRTPAAYPLGPPRPSGASPRGRCQGRDPQDPSGRDADGDQADEPPPDVYDDDDVIDDAAVSGHELLARELGAEVIDDIRHDGR